jgi:hypothetical protein
LDNKLQPRHEPSLAGAERAYSGLLLSPLLNRRVRGHYKTPTRMIFDTFQPRPG